MTVVRRAGSVYSGDWQQFLKLLMNEVPEGVQQVAVHCTECYGRYGSGLRQGRFFRFFVENNLKC